MHNTQTINSNPTIHANANPIDCISFADLALSKQLLKALNHSGYDAPTPIQAQAIPPALAGKDLLLSAQTGSGKTAAFVLPVLDTIIRNQSKKSQVHTVILTPTRELANQVSDSVRRYSSQMKDVFSVPLVGGAPYHGQIRALKKGVQIIIATPGRFIDHMNAGRIDLSALNMLILDEADRMLDMGFADDIKAIMTATPASRQTIMSSATWDGAVGKIAESFTTDPKRIAIKVQSAHIEEFAYYCDDLHHKNNLLDALLNDKNRGQTIIFTATKHSSETLANRLNEKGHKVRYLHGDLPQSKRNRITSDVKAGKVDILVATDVAARGIDISGITHVINYDMPRQVEDYVHRIGRSGRAGRTGIAMNLCGIDDRKQLDAINRYLKRHMTIAEVDGLEPSINTADRRFDEAKKGRNRGRRASQRNRFANDSRGSRGNNHSNSKSKSNNNSKSDNRNEQTFNTKKTNNRQDGSQFKRHNHLNRPNKVSRNGNSDKFGDVPVFTKELAAKGRKSAKSRKSAKAKFGKQHH